MGGGGGNREKLTVRWWEVEAERIHKDLLHYNFVRAKALSIKCKWNQNTFLNQRRNGEHLHQIS